MLQPRRMRIGIDARPMAKPEKTGIQHYTWNLVNHLASIEGNDHEFYLFYHSPDGRKSLDEFPCPSNPGFHRVVIRLRDLQTNRFDFLWWKVFVPFFIRRYSIDVFHGTSFHIPASHRSRMVVTIHDLAFFKQLTPIKSLEADCLKNGLTKATSRADRIIAVSEHTRLDVIKEFGVSSNLVKVVHHGVSELFHSHSSLTEENVDAELYDLPKNTILCVGSHEARKNITTLIKAYAQMKDRIGSKHHLVLAGKPGPDTNNINDLVKTLGLEKLVHFIGYVPDEALPNLYRSADLFVYPSLYEGFGLPVLEAMASGVPVVASRTSSLPEVVGDAGLLVDPLNPAEMAEAMEAVLTNKRLREDLRRRGLERAKRFRWEETARQTLAVYEEAYRCA